MLLIIILILVIVVLLNIRRGYLIKDDLDKIIYDMLVRVVIKLFNSFWFLFIIRVKKVDGIV